MIPSQVPPTARRAPAAALPARRPWRPDVLRLSLFIFIVVSISTVQAYFGILRALRLGLMMWVLSLAAVLFFPQGVRWSNLKASWPPRAVLLLGLISLVSIPFGLSIGGSGSYFLQGYGRILLFFIMLVVAIRGVPDLRFFTWAFVISAATLAVLSFTVMGSVMTYAGGMRLAATNMYDANDLGLIFVMAVPLALLVFQTSRGPLRLLAAASGAVVVLAIAVTGSRGAFVGFAVTLPGLFFAMSHVPMSRRLGVVAVLAVGLALGAPDGYWDRIMTIFEPSEDYNTTSHAGRVEIAKRGLGYMWQYPAFGVGLANFSRAEVTISEAAKSAMSGDQLLYLAPHNTYVQVGAELGFPALFIWLSLLATGMVGLRRLRAAGAARARAPDPTSDVGFLASACTYLPLTFLAFATGSFFVSHAYTPVFYVPAALLTGVMTLYKPASAPGATPAMSAPPSTRRGNGAAVPFPVSQLKTSRATTSLPDTLR